MNTQVSTSETNGLALLTDDDLSVYSIGISTGGSAEIKMAQQNPKRHIVATTIDTKGVTSAIEQVKAAGLSDQIEVKIEDVSEPLPYADGVFDYMYARLVLHYLPKQKLSSTLKELHRVVKPGGKLFVVVRSAECFDAKRPEATLDPETNLTSATVLDEWKGTPYTYSRYFHTKDSISKAVEAAGFAITYVKQYDEQLFMDFQRQLQAFQTDNVIELLAVKG